MNNWKKIWESRKDTLDGVDMTNYREVFIALKRINGFDVNGGPTADSLFRQYANTKKTFNLFSVGGGQYLKLVVAREPISIFLLATALK